MLIEGDPIAASNTQSQEAFAAREAKINAKGKRTIDFVSSSTSASDESRKTAQADKQARLDESAHGRSKRGRSSSSHHSTSDRHRRSREYARSETERPLETSLNSSHDDNIPSAHRLLETRYVLVVYYR